MKQKIHTLGGLLRAVTGNQAVPWTLADQYELEALQAKRIGDLREYHALQRNAQQQVLFEHGIRPRENFSVALPEQMSYKTIQRIVLAQFESQGTRAKPGRTNNLRRPKGKEYHSYILSDEHRGEYAQVSLALREGRVFVKMVPYQTPEKK